MCSLCLGTMRSPLSGLSNSHHTTEIIAAFQMRVLELREVQILAPANSGSQDSVRGLADASVSDHDTTSHGFQLPLTCTAMDFSSSLVSSALMVCRVTKFHGRECVCPQRIKNPKEDLLYMNFILKEMCL